MLISTVIPSFYPATVYGGTISASLNYAKALAAAGHTVKVSTTNTNMHSRLDVPTGEFIKIEEDILVKYYNETIVDKVSFPLVFNVWKDIRKADVVHVQAIFNSPIPVSLAYAKIFRKPVLLSPHGVLGDWIMNNGLKFKKPWLKLFIRPFANNVYWHATSEQERKEILSHFPKAKIYNVPNSVDLKEFENPGRFSKSVFLEKFGKQADRPEKIIVSMGRLQKKKGFDILINAFNNINLKTSGAYLFIAGEDEGEKVNLLKLVKDLDLEQKVFFTGNLEGQLKVDFLSNADVFVLPSHNENFGIVYAEALAAGTPIVASKYTPWEEVEEAGCGKWVDNSIDETEKAILKILNSDCERMSYNAKEFVKRFSFEEVSKKMEKVFIEIKNG